MPEKLNDSNPDSPIQDEAKGETDKKKAGNELDGWIPGEYGCFVYTPEPMYTENDVYIPEEFDDDDRDTSTLTEAARNVLLGLDDIFDKSDEAPRRIEIEQAWRGNQYDRGYQFLLHHRNGGWMIPSAGSGFGAKDQKRIASLYHTNIYGEKGEIITAALSNEVPEVEFFPIDPKSPADVQMAAVSEDLKDIWAKNNNLKQVQNQAAKIFWNSDRVLCVTRYELNGEEFGYETPDEAVAPIENNDPPSEEADDAANEESHIENDSPVKEGRKPRGRVRTLVLDKLSHKVSMVCNHQKEMVALYYVEDVDVSKARQSFSWMKSKIQGGGDGTGSTEFARIARENVHQNIPGSYVTGDSLNRHCVIKYTYLRQSFFFDESVSDEIREELLAKFPDGCLLVKAGTEFALARNESMDDHLHIAHPFGGNGQNRRALGESLLPIQDYLNELVCLLLDFAKRTITKRWYNSNIFDVSAVRKTGNQPGTIGPFLPDPRLTTPEQYILQEPQPQAQPWLFTAIQWIITSLTEQISGALPSLFGKGITGQVGSEGVEMQRDQALQRQASPWSALQDMFACAARQAVVLTAKCACEDIHDIIPGKGTVSIKLNNLKGNVNCFPEENSSFPESWDQKETRIMSIFDKIAELPPGNPLGTMFMGVENLQAIKSAIRMKDFTIEGEQSLEKQQNELEILLRTAPKSNVMKLQAQKTLDEATKGMAKHILEGSQPPPQAAQMMNLLEEHIKSMPDLVSFVDVRPDKSENHIVEAKVCFDWMNSPEGLEFQYGDEDQQASFKNVYLHWQAHDAAATKLNAPPPPQPKVSFSVAADKLPANEAAAVVTAGGIPAKPQDFDQADQVDANRDIQKKVVPDSIYLQGLHNKPQQV